MFSFLRRLNRKKNSQPSGRRGSRPGDQDSGGRIHQAAITGNALRVKQILFFQPAGLDERDPRSRTALHFACHYGRKKVVRLLVKRRCMLDICDVDNKTALIHAVQFQRVKCATILLENGADPNVADINGNTALHYAVRGDMAIVEKLLSCGASMEAKNKEGLTPLSLAQLENKEQIVSLLLNSGAALPTVDEMESNQQQTSENEEGRRPEASERRNLDTDLQESPKKPSRKRNAWTVDESSKEDSPRSNPGLDNSRDLSDHEDCKDEVISKTCMPTAKTSENQIEQIYLPPLHLEEQSPESEIYRACARVDISEQSGHYSVQYYEKQRSKQERLEEKKRLKLGREEPEQKCHEFCVKFKCDEQPTPPNVVPFHSRTWSSEDSTWSSNSEVCLGEKTLHSENDHKPDTEHVLNKKEESFRDDTENKLVWTPGVPFEVKEDEEFDMQMTENMNPNTTNWKLGVGHAPQSSVPKSHLDLRLAHGNETKYMIPIKSQDASAVTSICKETKPNQDSFQKPLNEHNYNASNCKSVESNLEDWSSSLPCSDGTPEVHANEKVQQDMQRDRNNADMCRAELLALSKEKVQLQKEDKLTPLSLAQRENQEQTVEFSVKAEASTLAVDEMESNPGLDNSWDLSDHEDCKVSDHYEKTESLLHENHMLKDENAKLRLGKGTVKNQNQEMEKKYFENIKIVKEKNDDLHKTIKHDEEILTETTFQHNGQLNVPTAEITMLNLKLENAKRNRERLETEAESYKSQLATAIQDYEQCQASQRDLQLAIQMERDEWSCLREKMNFDMSNLKNINESLCQEISKAESKFSSLEIELNHTRDDLREKKSVLEQVRSATKEKNDRIKEMKQLYEKQNDEHHKSLVRQRSIQEKISHLQNENQLLRQQLDDAHSKAEDEEKTVINTQDQFQDIIKALQTENEKQGLMLSERNEELISECHNLKEIIYQYENDKAKRDAFVSQLQQELADALRKQSVLEASLEVTSRDHMNLEDETQDLKEKLDENRSQVEENKKAKTYEKEVEGNIYYVAAADSDGIIQQTKSTQTDNQQYPMENEYSDRFILKEDKEKKQKSDLLYEEETEQLRNKEQYTKEVEINPQLETTVRTQEIDMNIISDGYEKEYLLRENHMLQDENAKLRLEIDTAKNQNQEMEKKYCENTKIIVEMIDHLNNIIQVTEIVLKKTIFEYVAQLKQLTVLKADKELLNFHLEDEKQNRERLETEVESYKSRLATALQDHEQCQASQRDVKLAFQAERDEWFCLRDKMNFDMSNLKDNNESLRQELSTAESKFSSLEIELNHTRNALRERTLVLKGVQRDLSETQDRKKGIEHLYKKEQEELHKYVAMQGSLQAKLSNLQSKNKLLQQQLDAAHNKTDDTAKALFNTQDKLRDIIKALQTENENEVLMLNERNKDLTSKCSHLEEIIHQYENHKAEIDAFVSQLQQELADALRKQYTLEALLDVSSRHRVNLEDETQNLKRKLDKNRSQIDDLTAKLEATSSKCLHLDEENKFLQQKLLSLKEIQEKCEKLENENQKWKQEVVNLKKQLQRIMVEFREVQQNQIIVEERARPDSQETQTSSQASLEPLRENHSTSSSLFTLRVEELEFELPRTKMTQDCKSKKYKKLYLKELQIRKSLTTKLNKTKKQLEDVRMELLLKEEENRFLLERLKHKACPRLAWY